MRHELERLGFEVSEMFDIYDFSFGYPVLTFVVASPTGSGAEVTFDPKECDLIVTDISKGGALSKEIADALKNVDVRVLGSKRR